MSEHGDSSSTDHFHPLDRLKRELTLWDAVMLVVASVVGSGIFFAPGRVAELLPHPGWILAAWLAGGLISLAGALANAELAAMFPRAGGDYVYVSEGVHPAAGFLVGWLSFAVIFTGTIAAVAAAFAEGIARPLGLGESATVAIAIGTTLFCSWINYVGVRWGARANNWTSVVKIAALAAFVFAGPLFGTGDWAQLFASGESAAPGATARAGAFALAMSPVLFSYLGWNASVFVASEIRDARRNVPRSLFYGLAICTSVYLAVNVVYLYALPLDELRGVPDAGGAAAVALFGPVSSRLVAAFVLISIFGTLSATVLVGPRIAYAMALDGRFFGRFDGVAEGYQTPGAAIALQAAISCALLLVLRSFPSALDFTTFAILLAAIADVVALFRLRRRQPSRPRPYRAWGHPWVPGLYALVSAAIAASLALANPLETAVCCAILVLGLLLYVGFVRGEASSA